MPANKSAAFELKGTAATLTVLRLKTADPVAVETELGARVAQLPHFFHNAPVVLDMEPLEQEAVPDFLALADALRRCKVVPVGVRNAKESWLPQAIAAGLGELKGATRKPQATGGTSQPKEQTETRPADAPDSNEAPPIAMEAPTTATSLMVKSPVRGGQVTYAQQADLILLGPVNPGAEVIADGSIHAYGPLRGRALAGAHGDQEARIFCNSLDAELVSISGHYLRADELPEDLRQKPAQIFLQDGTIKVIPM